MKRFPRRVAVVKYGAFAAVFCLLFLPRAVFAQTPAPLQEWQYSSGTVLYRLFEPVIPEWRIVTGLAFEPRPLYEGAKTYRTLVGPVLDVHYEDLWFASVGEGLGYNFLLSDHFRAGLALGYDLGRRASEDLDHLRGLGNISAAPVVKLFASYVISKDFPLVLRGDLRQFVGGANGMVGDLEAYMPLPGSSERLVMFAGPSITFADRLYMQTEFGVNPNQALASGYQNYLAHGGADSAGFGFSLTWFFTKHWLVNSELAANRLLGSAGESPITQTRVQGIYVLSTAYKW